MQLITVQSSNISQIGFKENITLSFGNPGQSILRIVFTNGLIYDYYNVEREDYERFLDAKSKGQYFHKYIKNVYQYEKIN